MTHIGVAWLVYWCPAWHQNESIDTKHVSSWLRSTLIKKCWLTNLLVSSDQPIGVKRPTKWGPVTPLLGSSDPSTCVNISAYRGRSTQLCWSTDSNAGVNWPLYLCHCIAGQMYWCRMTHYLSQMTLTNVSSDRSLGVNAIKLLDSSDLSVWVQCIVWKSIQFLVSPDTSSVAWHQ